MKRIPVNLKSGKAGRAKRFASRQARLACALAFLTLTSSLSLVACAMADNSKFNSTVWKEQRGVELRENKRLAMLDDLEHKLHPGMNREEVLALLGPPDSRDAMKSVDIYEVGISSVGIDGEVYRIVYQNGKLVSNQWSRW